MLAIRKPGRQLRASSVRITSFGLVSMAFESTTGALRSGGRVHIIGAGPVGLLLAALLQSQEGFSVRLYEKRREYTRSRMVHLASYLVADSLESYRADHFDGENVEAVF